MSGGPEEIRAKVEARKAELQRQAEEREEAARRERQKKKELASQLASERLSQLEAAAAAKAPSSGAPPQTEHPVGPAAELHSGGAVEVDEKQVDEELVENELDELINKKAQERWTSGENSMFLVTLIGGIILLFISWPIGLFSIGFSMFYLHVKQRRYRGMVRHELGLPSMFDGASPER